MILAEYYYKICPICDHQNPKERNYIKENFLWCLDCGTITKKKTQKRWKPLFIPLLKRITNELFVFTVVVMY